MNRNQWGFSYPADKLFAAATAKKEYHMSRLEWWKNKQKEVETTIRSEGLEIDVSVAAGANNAVSHLSSYRQPQVNIRTDLLKDFNECQSKVMSHHSKIQEYDAWCQVLESQGQTSFSLHQDDWLFFFGK